MQLLQHLLHLQAVVDHTPHHLDTRVGHGLLQAVVEKLCLVEHVTRIPQESVYLLGHLLRLIPLCPCSLDLLLHCLDPVLQFPHLLLECVAFLRLRPELPVLPKEAVHPGLQISEVLRLGERLDPVQHIRGLRVQVQADRLDKALHRVVLRFYYLVTLDHRIEGFPDLGLVLFIRLLMFRSLLRLLRLWSFGGGLFGQGLIGRGLIDQAPSELGWLASPLDRVGGDLSNARWVYFHRFPRLT